MKYSISKTAIIAAVFLLSASLTFAAETKQGTAGETKAISHGIATEKSAKAKGTKATAKAKLVDINSASKEELKTLPGIDDAQADKIIAGRPYLTKAHLVTHNVLANGVYEKLKTRVIAKQNQATAAKIAEKQKRH